MHELGIVQEIVAIVEERSQGKSVSALSLEIGKLSAVLPDAVRFCFDVAAEGTVLEGATLTVIEKDGLARCRSCAASVVLASPIGRCTCGAFDLEWLEGTDVKIVRMEVA